MNVGIIIVTDRHSAASSQLAARYPAWHRPADPADGPAADIILSIVDAMNEEDFGEVDLEGRSGPQPVWRPHYNSSVGIIAKQIDAIGRERVGLVVILGGCSKCSGLLCVCGSA
jgi:hypothetical protein